MRSPRVLFPDEMSKKESKNVDASKDTGKAFPHKLWENESMELIARGFNQITPIYLGNIKLTNVFPWC